MNASKISVEKERYKGKRDSIGGERATPKDRERCVARGSGRASELRFPEGMERGSVNRASGGTTEKGSRYYGK